jgi:hypothetical protein
MSDSMRERASDGDDYHKRHLPGCRKVMYDPQSSPCTCVTEYEREFTSARASERYAEELRGRLERLSLAMDWAITELIKADRPCSALGLLLESAGLTLKVSVTKKDGQP